MQMLGRLQRLVSSTCWESSPAGFPGLASSLPRLCAFLEDSVHPDLRWHVIDTQLVGPLRDLPVERIVGLELKVQKPARVTAVSAAPGVVVSGRLEVGAAEQGRNVIEDGAQQCTSGVGVVPAVVVVQLGNKLGEFPWIQADSLCPRRQAGADLRVNVAQAAGGRTARCR